MKIICEHCGTNINVEKYSICPNCKAPYNKNKEFIKYKEELEKNKKESAEFKKSIAKSANRATKVFVGIFIGIFVIGIVSYILMSYTSIRFFKKVTNNNTVNNVIDNINEELNKEIIEDFNKENTENNFELSYTKVEFANKLTWDGNIFYTAKKGYTYVLINVNIKNNTGKTMYIIDSNITCSIDGIVQENVTHKALDYKDLPNSLENGLIADGYVAYEVPSGSKSFDLTYNDKTIHIDAK